MQHIMVHGLRICLKQPQMGPLGLSGFGLVVYVSPLAPAPASPAVPCDSDVNTEHAIPCHDLQLRFGAHGPQGTYHLQAGGRREQQGRM